MDALIKVSHNCFSFWRRWFQREILYLIIIMRPKRFFVRWVWSIKIYVHVLMIIYYTRKFLNFWKNVWGMGYHVISWNKKDDDTIEEMEKHGPSMKVVWYLSIIPRMKRLFANPNDYKNLRWHVDERKCDGMYHHPVDSIQWKKFDYEFPSLVKSQ